VGDDFVSLDAFLRPPQPTAEAVVQQPADVAPAARDSEETIRAARRFRAGLSDAIDAAVARLLPQIARNVLARELRLDAADVAVVVAEALDRCGEQPLAIRVHSADAGALADLSIAIVADDTLARGDAVFELRSGTIDLRMDSRLHAILHTSA
jgi:flagellar biosynthesis/type III secretory pathway protein FliH